MSRVRPPKHLRLKKLVLRVLRQRDAGQLRGLLLRNRDWLRRWEATRPGDDSPQVPSVAQLRGLLRRLRRGMRAGTDIPFGIFVRGELVGQLTVNSISRGAFCSAQLGYWVAESHAGRGIAPRAVALVIDYLFDELDLHRVELSVRPENGASLRVVEKLGLRYEGTRKNYIHVAGRWCDHDCYALVREERRVSLTARFRGAGQG